MIGRWKMNFEELSLKYKEKNIVKLCKKLSKSFALTRSKDITNLYELAFWLYIYESKGETNKKDEIVANMKKVYSVPRTKEDTEESTWKFYTRIAGRQTLESVSYADEIERAIQNENKKGEEAYRFSGLCEMISYGVTGFYPHLVENRDKLEEKIEEYIQYLRS